MRGAAPTEIDPESGILIGASYVLKMYGQHVFASALPASIFSPRAPHVMLGCGAL
jgi:hypothetical protein